ncbi:hypothetical protein [Salinivibrio sp. ES.052]|uniref:hypothetical protein n=1 Tax=Salinivibrio sp. ES.052 TaxID=1882823 RepID=UPI00092BBA75|nr:hypothetical protein [Salinivibrio sp. ES.052]SIN81973.1 hypothetical protein SAMN05444724_0692 [Salinivibrio sp. ES.052]
MKAPHRLMESTSPSVHFLYVWLVSTIIACAAVIGAWQVGWITLTTFGGGAFYVGGLVWSAAGLVTYSRYKSRHWYRDSVTRRALTAHQHVMVSDSSSQPDDKLGLWLFLSGLPAMILSGMLMLRA